MGRKWKANRRGRFTDAVTNSGLPSSDQQAMFGLIATVPEPVAVGLLGLFIPWSLKRPRR